eukprot:TRINITY_DN5766_c0_g1_i5.p1 TRINITY_DN5766_c0_g1~~TRINITY_DN5766_c0_g1_i5.p1  ORF type:complete len:272 (+),score=47.67 TRINITY_DN5766_c0_g1_i5:896-1711(+)
MFTAADVQLLHTHTKATVSVLYWFCGRKRRETAVCTHTRDSEMPPPPAAAHPKLHQQQDLERREREGMDIDLHDTTPQDPELKPRRVFLLRHGQSESNRTGTDIRDAPLSRQGAQQALSWATEISKLVRPDVVIVSPLQRAAATGCLAFSQTSVPIEVCEYARELWWEEQQNKPRGREALEQTLRGVPRGPSVMWTTADPKARSEQESVSLLFEYLKARPERTIVVACHYGVISELTGCAAHNCELVECKFGSRGLRKLKTHMPPCGGSTW